jgi:hypothetical protein
MTVIVYALFVLACVYLLAGAFGLMIVQVSHARRTGRGLPVVDGSSLGAALSTSLRASATWPWTWKSWGR